MFEVLTFNDLRHWRHSRLDDSFLEVGLTAFNKDCYSEPVEKWGRAPHDVLNNMDTWLDVEQAAVALSAMGFENKNGPVWIREVENVF